MSQIRRSKIVAVAILYSCLVTSAARAGEEAYFDLPIDHLTLTQGKLPEPRRDSFDDRFGEFVVIDGPGEAHATLFTSFAAAAESSHPRLVVHTPDRRDVTGRLYLRGEGAKGTVELKFKIPASEAKPQARAIFFRTMADYYEDLLLDGAPGAAWFRVRAKEAREAAGGKPRDEFPSFRSRPNSLDDTYSLFSGNQALAENLQLDKVLPPGAAKPGEQQVDVDSIPGIAVAEIEWKNYIKGKHPSVDPLASAIPADQHAIFFRNFEALIALADEADRSGAIVVQIAETRSEDAGARSRYERQLGLSLTGLGRLLGPQLVGSVAITGSDPYLRVGSDLAILFMPKDGAALKNLILTQIGIARQMSPNAKDVDGKIGGLSYTGVRSPDRSLCSYMAVLNGGVMVVTNSPAQLARLAAVQDGTADALSKAPEYIFFRDRYKLDDPDESALLVLSDATIRRWCSAHWRIADSRRTRAAAIMSDLEARNLDALVAGKIDSEPLNDEYRVPGVGELHMTPHGVSSANYGSLGFFTPISEMKLDKVTVGEAEAYKRWRDTYETNWRGVFDPIAMRFHVSRKKLAADLTVMPLIYGSEYRPFIDVVTGAKIDSKSGDPHDSLFRAAMSINTNAAQFKAASIFVSQMAPNVKIDPFSWIGQSIWIYADDDPFWAAWAADNERNKSESTHFAGLPVALRVEVSNGFKLTAFLVALHAFVDQSAPGMAVWQNQTYKDQPYVKISPSEQAKGGQNEAIKDAAVYYRATGEALLITLNEGMVKRAIDRQLDRDEAKKTGKQLLPADQSLLGENLILQVNVNAKGFDKLDRLAHEESEKKMQQRSWSNLPILNELKHRYPDQDPLKLYELFFHARLIDPAGEQYVWNEKLQTMESTAYGSLAQPKEGSASIAVLKKLLRANLGITFENDGLRAKTEIDREEK